MVEPPDPLISQCGLLNVGGITFVFRAVEEKGATAERVLRAALAAIDAFSIDEMWNWNNDLDNCVPTSAQSALQLEIRRLLYRATRWFLQTRTGDIDRAKEVGYFHPVISKHAHGVSSMLQGNEAARYKRITDRFVQAGAPQELASQAASSLDVVTFLDVTDICAKTNESSDICDIRSGIARDGQRPPSGNQIA